MRAGLDAIRQSATAETQALLAIIDEQENDLVILRAELGRARELLEGAAPLLAASGQRVNAALVQSYVRHTAYLVAAKEGADDGQRHRN